MIGVLLGCYRVSRGLIRCCRTLGKLFKCNINRKGDVESAKVSKIDEGSDCSGEGTGQSALEKWVSGVNLVRRVSLGGDL